MSAASLSSLLLLLCDLVLHSACCLLHDMGGDWLLMISDVFPVTIVQGCDHIAVAHRIRQLVSCAHMRLLNAKVV